MKRWVVSTLFCCLLKMSGANGCTDFLLTTADGARINGRSLEFGIDLDTSFTLRPRGEKVSSQAPDGQAGMQWTSQYGYLAATAFGTEIVFDGLNEKGLSMGCLWLPGTEYQEGQGKPASQAIDYLDLGKWILGNFESVEELKAALPSICVWGHEIPELKMVAPMHVAVHDADGNSLVIEFIKGQMKVYDNPNTVLTNYPTFDWHTTNLANYINLTALNATPVNLRGGVLAPTGEGSGLLGIPGDWTPPSRFVRMTTFMRFSKQAGNAIEGVNLAEHLLNTVDIPIGVIRNHTRPFTAADYTQWIVIKDLSNKIFYFRTYTDLALKAIDIKRLNLSSGAPILALPVDTSTGYIDMTGKLKVAKKE